MFIIIVNEKYKIKKLSTVSYPLFPTFPFHSHRPTPLFQKQGRYISCVTRLFHKERGKEHLDLHLHVFT
jgi:hypothetical protein